MKKYTSYKQAAEVLGLAQPHSKSSKKLVKEFRRLEMKGHKPDTIWLKGDYGIRTKKKIISKTRNLVAVEEE